MEDDSGLFDIKPKIEPSRAMDYDDSKIDDDLDKLLQHIKEEQQNSMVSDLIKTQIKLMNTSFVTIFDLSFFFFVYNGCSESKFYFGRGQ